MSRYRSGNYEYGYDRPMQEYFLQEEYSEEEKEVYDSDFLEIVGSLGGIYGSALNLLTEIDKRHIEIPEAHRQAMINDLPF